MVVIELEKILEMREITKQFQGVLALDHVSLELGKGEILALLGENGAGKSTLMKILAGAYTPDSGEIYFNGEKLDVGNPRTMLKKGIAIVYQELNYYNDLSIAENMFVGEIPTGKCGFVAYRKLYQDTEMQLRRVGLKHNPKTLVSKLSVAEKQMIEIAKALSRDAKVFVLDEPTSALNDTEVRRLFAILREMTKEGISIIYISHKMDEIFELADRVEVLRDGRNIGTIPTRETNINQLVSMMVGRTITDMYPKTEVEKKGVALSVEHLCADHVNDVSFHVRAGEIVGLFGLMGAGRTEIVETIFGKRKRTGGSIHVNGEAVKISSPADAIRSGIGYIPRERKNDGLVLTASLSDNITYAYLKQLTRGGFIEFKKERDVVKTWIERLNIKTPGASVCIDSLSGGNQQKSVIAKWLLSEPKVLILNEPTRGIDVGAKVEIYCLMEELCRQGMAIVMISSEMPEVMGISDRIVIIHEGRVSGECARRDFSQEKLMLMAIGGKADA